MTKTTTQRGYGRRHQLARKHYQPLVDSGQASCTETICLYHSRHIVPGTPWDLAHTDDRSAYKGPAHAKCNRSDGQRRGMALRRRKLTNRATRRLPTW